MKNAAYFLSIWFKWEEVFKALSLTEKERDRLTINSRYRFVSPNGNDPEGLGIDDESALFEYYVTPNILGNGKYSYSSIFDQQLRMFFETPNILYPNVMEGRDSSFSIKFGKSVFSSGSIKLSGFMLCFSNSDIQKILLVTFDDKYLNLEKANKGWSDVFPYKAFVIDRSTHFSTIEDKKISAREVVLDRNTFMIGIYPQSQHDAQSFHLPTEFSEAIKKFYN